MTTNRYPFGATGEPPSPRLHGDPPNRADDVRRGGAADTLVSALLGGIAVLWIVLPLPLLGAAVVAGLTFGTPMTPEQHDDRQTALALAALAVVGLPALGLALARTARRRRRGAVRFHGAALALGALAVVGFATAGRLVQERQPAQPPGPRPVGCQERSGGGTDCPGG